MLHVALRGPAPCPAQLGVSQDGEDTPHTAQTVPAGLLVRLEVCAGHHMIHVRDQVTDEGREEGVPCVM